MVNNPQLNELLSENLLANVSHYTHRMYPIRPIARV